MGNKIKFKLGSPDKKNSKFIIDSLKTSFNFVKEGHASALITLPICKKTMKQYESQTMDELIVYLMKP